MSWKTTASLIKIFFYVQFLEKRPVVFLREKGETNRIISIVGWLINGNKIDVNFWVYSTEIKACTNISWSFIYVDFENIKFFPKLCSVGSFVVPEKGVLSARENSPLEKHYIIPEGDQPIFFVCIYTEK